MASVAKPVHALCATRTREPIALAELMLAGAADLVGVAVKFAIVDCDGHLVFSSVAYRHQQGMT